MNKAQELITLTEGEEGKVLKSGILAYFDSFAGPIPCKVLSVKTHNPNTPNTPNTDWTVRVKLTGSAKGYKKGEELKSNALHVVPHKALVTRSGQYRITHYTIEGD